MSDAATALREPWPALEHQREGVTVGIWLFIASEEPHGCVNGP